MARYYFHGDICSAPQSEAKCGVDAKWFYDARLNQVLVVSPETTRASSADLRRLRYQLRCKRYFLGRNGSRPDDPENVFASQVPAPAKKKAPGRRGLNRPNPEAAELYLRLAENYRLQMALHCANCHRGRLQHAGDKCLFEASEWAPGKPLVRPSP